MAVHTQLPAQALLPLPAHRTYLYFYVHALINHYGKRLNNFARQAEHAPVCDPALNS